MKASKTFWIGAGLTLISLVQVIVQYSWARWIGVGLGLFLMVFGWKIGWTRYRNFTVILGHLAVFCGLLVSAYGLYQIPFLKSAPTFLQVLDLPLFWGGFTLWGGHCMITHGYCNCAIGMNRKNNPDNEGSAKKPPSA